MKSLSNRQSKVHIFSLFALGAIALASCNGAAVPTSGDNGGEEAPTQMVVTEIVESSLPAPSPTAASGWQELARMRYPRSEMSAAVLNGKIYVPGGFLQGQVATSGVKTIEVFDPAENTWQKLANMPTERHHLMTAAYDDLLYVIGGMDEFWNPMDTVWSYDPAQDGWTELNPMPKSIGAGTAVVLGEYIYILGGVSDGTSLLRYDPAADSWEELAPMQYAREHLAAVVFENKIYALAGRWHAGELSSVEVYDPQTNTWEEITPMQFPRGGHAAAVLDGRILVIGGEVLEKSITLTSVEAYDPVMDVWEDFDDLPVPLHGVPAVTLGGYVYVLGGSREAWAVANTGITYVYIP